MQIVQNGNYLYISAEINIACVVKIILRGKYSHSLHRNDTGLQEPKKTGLKDCCFICFELRAILLCEYQKCLQPHL